MLMKMWGIGSHYIVLRGIKHILATVDVMMTITFKILKLQLV